jgi:glycosyl transferase family 25
LAVFYESIEGWFDFDDIYELALRRCGSKPAWFVEVGAYKGRSTCYLAERIRETGLDIRFDVVDTFAGDPHVGQCDSWPEFLANLERAGLFFTLTLHRCLSVDAAATFPDQKLDFVFIDAGHCFDAVGRDLAAWWPKIGQGGLIAGHDYTYGPEVKAAVDAFVAAHGLGRAFRTSRNSWMIYKTLTIDSAYCINLGRRPDRRRVAAAQFEAADLSARVAFFDAIDGSVLMHAGAVSDGQAGCCMSHLAVLRAARAKGHRHVLVFEDDVRLVGDFTARLDAALARCPASYDLCYLGAICRASWGNFLYPFDDLLARAGSVCGTHAYLANLDCYPDIAANLDGMRNVIDNWYANKLQPRGNCYVCTPYLAAQSPGFSDIAKDFNANGSYADYVWR